MSNIRTARIAFDFNKREDEDVYYFSVPEKYDNNLSYDEILLVDTKYGARFGYFSFYKEFEEGGFVPEKPVLARKETPYALMHPHINDALFNLEGFIIAKGIDDRYLKYRLRNRGFVGILNQMIENNLRSAIISVESKEFDPVESYRYLYIEMEIGKIEDKAYAIDLLNMYIVGDKFISIKITEAGNEIYYMLNRPAIKDDILSIGEKNFDIDCNAILRYGHVIEKILDQKMTYSTDIMTNYFYTFREVNSKLPSNTDITFGYIVDVKAEYSRIFEFKSTDALGIYDTYFIMEYVIDECILGSGYYYDEDDDEDEDIDDDEDDDIDVNDEKDEENK